MLGRNADSDPSGLNYWSGLLDSGKTVDAVIDGFVNSNEFTGICSEAGIKRK